MKTVKWCLGVFIIILLAIPLMGASETKRLSDPQKFEVTFTITYNAISLTRAAELEKIVKERFKDPCSISVRVSSANDVGITTNSVRVYDWGTAVR